MSSKDEIRSEYFRWLCNLVAADEPDHSYLILMKILYNQEFYWFIEKDKNRASDGLRLRDEFAESHGYSDIFLKNKKCSVLEMMIGLAIQMEFILYNPNFGDRTAIWFWVMIENLELDEFTDDYYATYPFFENDVKVAISTVLNRTYTRNGAGGLFPLHKRCKDQRKVEIWYQLNAFLLENYDVSEIKY